MVRAQGGDPRVCDDPEGVLPKARYRETIRSPRSGVVARMEARGIGEAVRLLGGGRMRREDPIDPAVGLRDCRKVGEPVSVGEPLMEVLYDDPSAFAAARGLFVEALAVADAAEPRPLLIERIE
jgi:thymidine phosphorylase